MDRTRKITIQDVARHANVSAGTIDRVIHNRGRVSPDKRKRVEEAIASLNFNPNMLARTLALGKDFSISVLIPAAPSADHYWAMPLQGIRMATIQFKDYGINTDCCFYDQFDENSFSNKADEILETGPDGVVLAPLFLQESRNFVKKLKNQGIPFVFIDADIPGEQSLSYIGPDVKRSAFIAGKLLDTVLPRNGEILIINMVKGFGNASALHRMEEGFRAYFRQKGARNSILAFTIHSTQKEMVFRELTKFYIKNPGIKGVFVTNSKSFLISEFHRTHELDIRLVGYDLVEDNICHLKNGGIDYIISQSPFQQGKRAVQTLFDHFVFKKEPGSVQYVPLDIIIRENVDYYLEFNRLNALETKKN